MARVEFVMLQRRASETSRASPDLSTSLSEDFLRSDRQGKIARCLGYSLVLCHRVMDAFGLLRPALARSLSRPIYGLWTHAVTLATDGHGAGCMPILALCMGQRPSQQGLRSIRVISQT